MIWFILTYWQVMRKSIELAAKVQSNTLQDYKYYRSLDKKHQNTLKRDIASQPYYYSMIAKSIADAYVRNGEKEKGLKYLLNALKPVDSEFRSYLVQLQNTKAENKQKKVDQVQEITPFYEYLFDAMQPYDSSYASNRMKQINADIMKALNH